MHPLRAAPGVRRPASVLLAVLLSCCAFQKPHDQVWDMLAVGLPGEAAPRVAILNMGYYLLRQTHRTLFEAQSNGQYSSRLLSRWSRSMDSLDYTLCPLGGLRFDDKRPFDSAFLASFLSLRLPALDPKAAVGLEEGCVRVVMTRSGGRFLPFFADMANAPSVPTDDPRTELGLGDFRVKEISPTRIVLLRKEEVGDGYNRVVMHAHRGAGDPLLEDRSIEDLNRVLVQNFPEWPKAAYADYGVTLLQSVNLLIDAPDRKMRRLIYGCLDPARFRQAFMPRQRDFADIASVLPVGLRGARPGSPIQNCPADKAPAGVPPLTFANWNSGNEAGVRSEFERLAAATGLRFKVTAISQDDFVKQIMSRDRTFDLAVIALDATSPDYSAFYGPVIGAQGGFSRASLPRAQTLLHRMMAEPDESSLLRDIAEMDAILAEEGLILPLYQETRTFFYPKGLKGLDLGNNFLEYPDVGQIRF